MLSYQTIQPDTLELLKHLMAEYSEYRAMLSLTYFEDAEQNPMPEMFVDVSWKEMKQSILKAVEAYNNA